MKTEKKHVYAIPAIFQNEVEREKSELADIERGRRERGWRQLLFTRDAALRDGIAVAKKRAADKAADVDRLRDYPLNQLYGFFINHELPIEELAARLAQRKIIAEHAEEIKALAHKIFVEPAERALAEFEKEHQAILAGVNLEPVEAPKFVGAPRTGYLDDAKPVPSEAGLRAALGLPPL